MTAVIIFKDSPAAEAPTIDDGKLALFNDGGALYTKDDAGAVALVNARPTYEVLKLNRSSGAALPDDDYFVFGSGGVENYDVDRDASFYHGAAPSEGILLDPGVYVVTFNFGAGGSSLTVGEAQLQVSPNDIDDSTGLDTLVIPTVVGGSPYGTLGGLMWLVGDGGVAVYAHNYTGDDLIGLTCNLTITRLGDVG